MNTGRFGFPETARIGAKVESSVVQSIANSSNVALIFDTVIRDDLGFFDITAPTRLTVPFGRSGWYIVTAATSNAARTGLGRRIFIRLNGQKFISGSSVASVADHNDPFLSTACIEYLNGGDYLEAVVVQNSGSALNTAVSSIFPSLSLVFLS